MLKYETMAGSGSGYVGGEEGFFLKIELRDGYLYALAGGDKLTAHISAAYWNEIAERCFESDCSRILIEKDFVEGVGPDEMLLMADHLGKLLPGRVIAFVDRHRHSAINELGKRLARNRSVKMQTFENILEAEKWLMSN